MRLSSRYPLAAIALYLATIIGMTLLALLVVVR
jgi:hypothetical protein